jgi:N4-gp56 family major capsid protein
MAIQALNTSAPRIGKLKGEILAHAVPKLVLGISGDQKKMTKNMSDTVVYRRWLPKGGATTNATTINQWSVTAAAHQVAEGVTPTAETMAPQDITVQLQQYMCLYSYTDKVADLYEDKIPDAMKEQAGERMGLVREMVDFGALKGCTNKFYAGGTSRATVDEPISLSILRKATKSIKGNRGSFATSVLSAGPNYGTTSVERGYIVYAHTDCENDIRNLPGFKEVSEYANQKRLHECELGSCEGFRFIISPELDAIADSGAAIGSDGLVSTTGTSNDVYPYIVVAKDFWANVALRGMESFDVFHVPVNQRDKSDPGGQRGFIGAKFYSAAFVQNDGWGAVLECGSTDI